MLNVGSEIIVYGFNDFNVGVFSPVCFHLFRHYTFYNKLHVVDDRILDLFYSSVKCVYKIEI